MSETCANCRESMCHDSVLHICECGNPSSPFYHSECELGASCPHHVADDDAPAWVLSAPQGEMPL